jgi:hypothetical protein
MNKKLGLILLFAGAYVVLLGGLFWNMSAPAGKYNVYDWFWGLSAGIVIACGAGLALKKNVIGLAGFGLAVAGIVYSIIILAIGSAKESYFSVWILIGAILSTFGVIIGVLFHLRDAARLKKYGPTLM